MKRLRLLLLAFMLLAWGLRLHHLDVQSLWYDEGVTAQVARLGMRQLAGWTAADIQPPLYYLVVGGWLRLLQPWAGSLAYVLRFLSAGFGLLLTPLLWAIGRRLWDERAGLLAAWAATAAPLLVYYGQEARMYALLALLGAAGMWALVGLVLKPRGRWAVALGLINAAGLYTQYAYPLLIAAQGLLVLIALVQRRRQRPAMLRLFGLYAGSLALSGLLFLPLAPTAWAQVTNWPST
ncbi:MAG: glycosyltransferase family 39 protein, partial [Caldilineales bacterium]|nr:glycosyltransferase family 39 protein [Caldilineales bacterium]